MFQVLKQIFIRLLNSIVNTSSHTKCVSLNNQKHMTQSTLINLHYYPSEYTQRLL